MVTFLMAYRCPGSPVGTYPQGDRLDRPTCNRESTRVVGTIYDARGLVALRQSALSSVIRVDWQCRSKADCAQYDAVSLWEAIAKQYEGRVWSVSCFYVPSVCAELSTALGVRPTFWALQPGVQEMVPFNDATSAQAVLQWVQDAMSCTSSTNESNEVPNKARMNSSPPLTNHPLTTQ